MKLRKEGNVTWDGFDSQVAPYDDRREKKWHAGIWVLLAAIFGLVMLYTTTHLIKERRLVAHGTRVLARYNEESGIATFTDEQGNYYFISMIYFTPNNKSL